jgi:hypothetical protein
MKSKSASIYYRVVQPYRRDKARDSTIIQRAATAADAFAEIDRLSAQMVRTGAPNDAIETDWGRPERQIVPRPSEARGVPLMRGR